MKCAYHPDREPMGMCVACGRLICVECKAVLGGKIYCTPCADKIFVLDNSETTLQYFNGFPKEVRPEDIPEVKDMVDTPTPTLLEQNKKPDLTSQPAPVRAISRQSSSAPHGIGKARTLKVLKVELPLAGDISVQNIASRLSFITVPLSDITIASFIISILILIALVLMPWVELPGFSLGIFGIDFWISAGCTILLLAYIGATFIFNSKIRSLSHIVAALMCLILWSVFRFTMFPEIARFAIEDGDMMGIGLTVFVVAAILGIIVGILEILLKVKRPLELKRE